MDAPSPLFQPPPGDIYALVPYAPPSGPRQLVVYQRGAAALERVPIVRSRVVPAAVVAQQGINISREGEAQALIPLYTVLVEGLTLEPGALIQSGAPSAETLSYLAHFGQQPDAGQTFQGFTSAMEVVRRHLDYNYLLLCQLLLANSAAFEAPQKSSVVLLFKALSYATLTEESVALFCLHKALYDDDANAQARGRLPLYIEAVSYQLVRKLLARVERTRDVRLHIGTLFFFFISLNAALSSWFASSSSSSADPMSRIIRSASRDPLRFSGADAAEERAKQRDAIRLRELSLKFIQSKERFKAETAAILTTSDPSATAHTFMLTMDMIVQLAIPLYSALIVKNDEPSFTAAVASIVHAQAFFAAGAGGGGGASPILAKIGSAAADCDAHSSSTDESDHLSSLQFDSDSDDTDTDDELHVVSA